MVSAVLSPDSKHEANDYLEGEYSKSDIKEYPKPPVRPSDVFSRLNKPKHSRYKSGVNSHRISFTPQLKEGINPPKTPAPAKVTNSGNKLKSGVLKTEGNEHMKSLNSSKYQIDICSVDEEDSNDETVERIQKPPNTQRDRKTTSIIPKAIRKL